MHSGALICRAVIINPVGTVNGVQNLSRRVYRSNRERVRYVQISLIYSALIAVLVGISLSVLLIRRKIDSAAQIARFPFLENGYFAILIVTVIYGQ